ncbi:cytochrome c [uncultured Rhodoferax sp.]|uniref:c-type cytochrome n=1 Tax=uncultured Rhodoferax sp. TaxID=223188 RepID=UPI0025E5C3D1|nr:cytochrome c [uncultured Rhodoferax sp.]
MRRILYLLTVLALGLGLVLAILVWRELRASPTVAATPTSRTAPAMETVQRGAYLAQVGNCALCHTTPGGEPYAGGKGVPTPFGTVYTSNLTPHPQTGLGAWDAEDFWRAMHEGRSRDGHLLYPAFPYTSFTQLARDDSDALFAYLQTLTPADTPNRVHTLRWPYGTQWALAVWRVVNFHPSPAQANAPTGSDVALRGAYLVHGLAHCNECHGGRNAWGAPDLRQTLGGATLPQSLWYAPSLRSAREAGVAAWSVEDTVALLTTGANAHAVASGPMAEVVHHSTQHLSTTDAQAMARYLAGLAPADAGLPTPKPVPTGVQALGGRVYEAQCAQCHGKQGEGRAGAYPALAGNRAVQMPQYQNLVLGVLQGGFGPSTHGLPQPHGMPPFQLVLTDAELAAVLSYIRNAWGNQAPALSEFDINKFRNLQAP